MAIRLRSPFYKSGMSQKAGSIPISISLGQMKYWDSVSESLFTKIFGNIDRLDLTTVQGQTSAFMRCAPVSAIIGRLAEYSMNGRYTFVDSQGKELTTVKNNLFAILQKPNFQQTWSEFIAAAMTYVKLNGQAYILPIIPAGFEAVKGSAKSLFVVPNWAVTPMYSGKNVFQTSIESVVTGYNISFLNKTIPANQMLVIRDSSPSVNMDATKLFEGQSRLYSMGDQVNNLIAIQDAIYNMTVKRGALGAWVPENSKDGMGAMLPLESKERDEVLNAFLQYGVNSNNLAPFQVLRYGMKWVQAAMNVSDLKLFEGNEAAIAQISMSMNVPLYLLGFKDSTFTNLEAAGKSCYTSGVIPAVNNICQNLTDYFGCDGYSLKAFFDHLEIFQKSKKDEADALNAMTTALDKPYKARVIGTSEYRSLMANFMPIGVQFDPLLLPVDLYEGTPTQTIVTQ